MAFPRGVEWRARRQSEQGAECALSGLMCGSLRRLMHLGFACPQRAGVDLPGLILCQPDSGEMALEVRLS